MGDRHIPIIDEDALDDIVLALQSLSAPSATNVAVDATSMDIITATNAQGALAQLDSAVDSVNASLTNLSGAITDQFNTRITDLNAVLNAGCNDITFSVYSASASNKPTSNSGFAITLGSGVYRQQIAFELAGEIYTRYYNNGTITSWVKRG